MTPKYAVSFLRSIADGIDTAKNPSRSLVASDIKGLIIALETGGAVDADFAATFDRAFDSIDRMTGDHNMVLVFDLRQKILKSKPGMASKFDDQMLKLRDAGLIELEPYNKQAGRLTPDYIEGGINDGTNAYVWVSKVTEKPVTKNTPFSPHEFDEDVVFGA